MWALIGVCASVAVGIGLTGLAAQFSLSWSLLGLRLVARQTIVNATQAVVVCLFVYSLLWHLRGWAARSQPR